MKRIKATCQLLDYFTTGELISERVIGEYDTVDEASLAAHKVREANETVCIYGGLAPEDEWASAREMAESEADWEECNRV